MKYKNWTQEELIKKLIECEKENEKLKKELNKKTQRKKPGRKPYSKDINEKIIKLRREGLSYREIAKKINVSTWKVSNILSPIENNGKED